MIPILSVFHVIVPFATDLSGITSEQNLLRPWLICYPLGQVLLFLAYLFFVRAQLEGEIQQPVIYKIDKVIGREEVEVENAGCCGAKTKVQSENICEAGMYTLRPRFQFYDEVLLELD